ncbi:serine-type endopeptidase [Fragilaria crotonensis]|nr:serine-type endopeptidase [Fragilaria crotonensis]
MTRRLFLPLLCLVLQAAGHVVAPAMDEAESYIPTKMRDLGSRIVGGFKADPKRHPFFTQLLVSTESDSAWECGGTLIAADVVLTAAHCVTTDDSWDPIWSIEMWVNSTSVYYSPYEYYRSAISYLVYPLYDDTTLSHDLALIFLDEPVKGVTLAKINKNANSPAVGKALTAIGLGLMQRPSEVEATYLMQVSMNTRAGSDCSSFFGAAYFKNRNQICAGSTKGYLPRRFRRSAAYFWHKCKH